MSGRETYPEEESFWTEGGGTGPVGTEQGEGERKGQRQWLKSIMHIYIAVEMHTLLPDGVCICIVY